MLAALALCTIAAPPQPDVPATEAGIVAATNELRRAEGRVPVATNALLARTAREFAAFMAQHDEFSHQADGRNAAQRATDNGYRYCVIEENIASSYSSAGFSAASLSQRVVEGWKGSPEHRTNMLDTSIVETGVGLAQSAASGTWYSVQLFGRPRHMSIAFRIMNESREAVRYQVGERRETLQPQTGNRHEICRAQRLTVVGAEPPANGAWPVEPQDGEEFIVVQRGAGLEVRRPLR